MSSFGYQKYPNHFLRNDLRTDISLIKKKRINKFSKKNYNVFGKKTNSSTFQKSIDSGIYATEMRCGCANRPMKTDLESWFHF